MPSVVELTAAIAVANDNLAVANDNLAALVQQQVKAKEREEQEVKDATVGSVV